jgi:hypothetical protein
MALDEVSELLGRHQCVDEVSNIERVVESNILFEGGIDVARVFSDHGE